jgi:diguanylate cyclase (GGDEF)-like protein
MMQSSIQLSRTERKMQMQQATIMLSRALSYNWFDGDREMLHSFLLRVVNEGPLVFAKITDADGKSITAAAKPAYRQKMASTAIILEEMTDIVGEPELVFSADGEPSHMVVTVPISLLSSDPEVTPKKGGGVRLVGYLKTAMGVNEWHQAMANKLDIVIGVSIIAGSMAVLLGFLLIRRIVMPLDKIASKMREFSHGDLDVRVQVHRNDEIGTLSRTFDAMADEHQKTVERLVRLNEELENRVIERTRQLEELASKDPLTGIFNRRYFNDMLEHHFSSAKRYNQDLACLMVDLDDFKKVNDEYGHHVGDDLLKLAAETITDELRSADVCARYGGDEFVVLLPQTDVDHASALGFRILEKLENNLTTQLPRIRSAISVGITSLSSIKAENAEDIVREADRAMYAAKADGKGRMVTTGKS